jgi:glycosyltransferase involved in cell wall biosynthesis
LVVPEAASVGVPAVVSDTSAAIESVRDGVNGLVFRNGNLSSLKSALRLLSDDTLVGRMGTTCYQAYWNAPPTLDKHVAALETLYHTILRQPRGELRLK